MFTWICPKCGSEVPPAYSDCPNCAPSAKDQPPASATAATTMVEAVPPRPAAPAPARRPKVPAWLMTIGFAIVFAGAGFGAFYLFRSQPAASPSATAPGAATQAPAAQLLPVLQSVPEFKTVEFTGLRLTEDKQQKAVLQFLIVNHSAADLGQIGAKVNLRAIANSQDQEPVGSFVFKCNLGPYESKELKVPVVTKLRVYELPDWQFLRAEVPPK